MNTYLYALSYGRELSDNDLTKLGCVLAREIWAEAGRHVTDEDVYPERIIYNNGVPVKSDYEHMFATPTSSECSLSGITEFPLTYTYTASVGTVIDRKDKEYVSIRYFEYAVRRNAIMDMPCDKRLSLLEIMTNGDYPYGDVDYYEIYILFPDSKYARKFSESYGVPAFPTMYASVYEALPNKLRYMEGANCIEGVCEHYYKTVVGDE